MKQLLIILILTIPFSLLSQECDCEINFNWVKKTFEENDAGFSYAIEIKGKKAYEMHNEVFIKKVRGISNSLECTQTLKEWLAFFRSGHIAIKRIDIDPNHTTNEEKGKDEIIEQFRDWEKLEVDIEQFTEYIQSKKIIDYEGIWETNNYLIGIKKVNDIYLGFIIEADGVYWTKGQVKLKINVDESITYYMRDHSVNTFKNSKLVGDIFLEMGYITYKRISPELESNVAIEKYINTITTKNPYFEMINNSTALLRIPTFQGADTKIKIDSVILENKKSIQETPNLIIDIRNNGGGSDRSYKEILPFLYTNPIRTVGLEYLSTSLNNQRMLDFINDPIWGFDEEEKKWAKESYDTLSEREGEFVNLDSTIVEIATLDTIYANPINVGIIINESNGSTAEQFLLAAKQSKKVKLFGTTTFGVLDISNMYFVKSPCEEFELGYCLSRSMRIPEMAIDGKGIQPDYYIDKSIPKYKWVEFVTNILNE